MSDFTQGPAETFCELHGPIYDAGYCRLCSSLTPEHKAELLRASRNHETAMDRASAPEMLNVCAAEIRSAEKA